MWQDLSLNILILIYKSKTDPVAKERLATFEAVASDPAREKVYANKLSKLRPLSATTWSGQTSNKSMRAGKGSNGWKAWNMRWSLQFDALTVCS